MSLNLNMNLFCDSLFKKFISVFLLIILFALVLIFILNFLHLDEKFKLKFSEDDKCLDEENNSEFKIIETKYGKIRGIRKTEVGKDINVFLGIPYAKPPLDEVKIFTKNNQIK